MSSSRDKYIKLMATVGISLLFINTQLINTQSPANYSPQVRPLVKRPGLLTSAAGSCGARHEGEERLAGNSLLSIWEETQGSPQTLQQEAEVSCQLWIFYLFISLNIWIFARFDIKHHLMYCENYKELLHFSLRFPLIVDFRLSISSQCDS